MGEETEVPEVPGSDTAIREYIGVFRVSYQTDAYNGEDVSLADVTARIGGALGMVNGYTPTVLRIWVKPDED